jgi:hypothetical protein
MDICVLINYFIVFFFRYQYLSNVVLQARSACNTHATVKSMVDHSDNGLLELLEGKLVVLCFQMKIKEELERIASRVETLGTGDTSPSNDPFPAREYEDTEDMGIRVSDTDTAITEIRTRGTKY